MSNSSKSPFQTFKEDFYKEVSKSSQITAGPAIIISPETIKRVGIKNPDPSRIIPPPVSVSIDH